MADPWDSQGSHSEAGGVVSSEGTPACGALAIPASYRTIRYVSINLPQAPVPAQPSTKQAGITYKSIGSC